MNIIQGTHYWRLSSFILAFLLFFGLYYFCVTYPKHTEQDRMQFAEELMQIGFWQNLDSERQINLSLLSEPTTLNVVNDEIYMHQLNQLRMLSDFSYKKTLIQLSQSHSELSGLNEKSLDGLCLQLKFVQRYHLAIDQNSYQTAVLEKMSAFNQRNIQDIQFWLDDLAALQQYLKTVENEHFESKCSTV